MWTTQRMIGPRVVLLYASLLLWLPACGDDDKGGGPTPTATHTPVPTNTVTRTPTPCPSATPPLCPPFEHPLCDPDPCLGCACEPCPPYPVGEVPAGGQNSCLCATPTPTTTPTDTPTITPTATPVPVLRGSSKSSAIALASNESLVVVTNPDNDSISIFRTVDNTRLATLETGDEPSAVVLHPDNVTAFVANRAAATVVRVSSIDTTAPVVSRSIDVGSEPTALALSPTGAKLFVAEWAEGRVTAIDTATMTILGVIDAPNHPRGLAVTNDGDTDDDDETLALTEFFGEPNADVTGCPTLNAEGCDTGRIGRVRLYNVADLTPQAPILFQPLDSGIVPAGSAEGTPSVMTAPNQLYAAALQNGKIYVSSVSASPQPPIRFNANVFPVVYVGTLDSVTRGEDRSNVGTANLAKLANDRLGDAPGTDRFFLGEPVDLAFDGETNIAYVASRAADVLQRVVYDDVSGISLGTEAVAQINLAPACQNPIGVVVSEGLRRAYVNCWITRRLAVIDLTTQTLAATAQSADLPELGSAGDDVRLGARFFFTGRGRWSEEGEGYSSCGSCHPDGLTDNITWSFAAGPRQTTSMDGTFSHGIGPQKPRILNWTSIFDELHDFERNTRGVSGGLGAITTSATGECGTLAAEQPVAIPADGLGQPLKEIQDTTAGVCTTDWDKIDAFVKTIRPPRGRRTLDPASVAQGALLFGVPSDGAGPGIGVETGQCHTCHGGPGWTASRRYWTPSSANNSGLKVAPFTPPTADPFWPLHTVQIGTQPAAADTTGANIAPNEVACTLRSLGTFGVPIVGDESATDALERKADGTRAQGRGGFNVPSLYGLAVGAPYLHHGQAATLFAALSDARWQAHLKAGNANFNPTVDELGHLVNFLLSIDATTPEIPLPDDADGCPPVFPPGTGFSATLTGDQEVPPVSTGAAGAAALELSGDGTLLNYDLGVEMLAPAAIQQAHIHVAPGSFNGPVVTFLAHGGFASPARGTLSPADLLPNPTAGIDDFTDLIAALRLGDAYVNVHSSTHPGGEVRGQVRGPLPFLASLRGDQEVPLPVTTAATGHAMLTLNPEADRLDFQVVVSGLNPAQIVGAHLHVAPVGFNGPVVFFLTPGTPAALPLIGSLTAADLLPNADVSVETFADFVAALKAGDVYVNVHTMTNPGGEIRGQLGGRLQVGTTLVGDEEVPSVTTDATGRADLLLTTDQTQLRFALQVIGIPSDQITQAHIHVGPPGMNGPPVFFLSNGPFAGLRRDILTEANLLPSPSTGINSFADFVAALKAGNTYVNVHTIAHMGGEVRGQVPAAMMFGATLTGSEEVPDPVVTDATGVARVVVDPSETQLRFALAVSDLPADQITQAHLHVGAPGMTGPPVLFLADMGFGGLRVGTLTEADLLPNPDAGIHTLADVIAALRAGNVYANVHSMSHPGGEIRGQLE